MGVAIFGLVMVCAASAVFGDSTVHEPQAPRVLNNFVTEVLNVDFTAGLDSHTFVFDNPRRGWIFFRLTASGPGSAKCVLELPDLIGVPNVTLAAHDLAEERTYEAMRFLPRLPSPLR